MSISNTKKKSTERPTIHEVDIDRIIIDSRLQARVTLDERTVAEYQRAAEEAAEEGNPWPFPSIQTVGGYLVDGWHRLEVAKRLGMKSIPADEQRGETETDCIRAAVGANASHGLPRSNADKRRAVELALATWPEWSARQIAKVCRVSRMTVNRIREDEPDETKVALVPPCEDEPDETKVALVPPCEDEPDETKVALVPPCEPEPEPKHADEQSGSADPRQDTAAMIAAESRKLDEFARKIKSLAARDGGQCLAMEMQQIEIDYRKLKHRINQTAFWADCPTCEDGCKECHNIGWLPHNRKNSLSTAAMAAIQ